MKMSGTPEALHNSNRDSSPVVSSPTTLLPTKSNVKVLSEAENGDLYLKVFLVGKGKNGNQWNIDDSTAEQNIKSAIGKPLVIYKDTGLEPDRVRMTPGGLMGEWPRKKGQYNHPPWDPHSIEHSREIQKQFAVGEIERYAKNQSTGDYWGMVKVTDPDLKQVLKTNPTLPFYVSPQLWRLNPNETHNLKTWEFMHLAIVSVPAFGARATVQGSCAGDKDSCTRQFLVANASLADMPQIDESTGHRKPCGCMFKAMKEVAEQTVETERTGRTIFDMINPDTSQITNSSNFKTEERLSDNTQNTVNTGVSNAATFPESVAAHEASVRTGTESQPQQRIAVEHKTYPQPETHTYRPNAPIDNTNDNNATKPNNDKLALIARFEQEKASKKEALQQLKVLARDNQKLAHDAERYQNELAEVKSYMKQQQAAVRENGIAEVIYNANLADLVPEDKKEELIKFSISKNLEPKEVAQLITPLYEAFDNFIASQRQNGNQEVPQFNTPQNNNNVTANAALRRESRLKLGNTPREANNPAFNASLNHGSSSTSEPAFLRVRKLTGIYTPNDGEVAL